MKSAVGKPKSKLLLADLRQLIAEARQDVARQEEAMTKNSAPCKTSPRSPAKRIRGSLTPELKQARIPSPVVTELAVTPFPTETKCEAKTAS